jgi:hypothetical protein
MADQRLTSDSSVSAVIAGFTQAARAGRELRAALSHVDADLGTMPVRNVRTRHVSALLDDLEAAGISPRREEAVIDALDGLFAFARGEGLVTTDPVADALDAAPEPHDSPAPPIASLAPASGAATATATMLALGARVASWTAGAILIVFLLLLVALVAELA